MPVPEERPSKKDAAARAQLPSEHARIGTVLASKYRVDAILGSGGMGIVLAATHLQLKERFAIKLLLPEASVRADAVGRFLREARVAMKMRGEHVVRIYDVGTLDDGAPFIAMECLEGRDLRAVLLEDGKLAPTVAVDYVLQACEAIAEAHALGVIHRDLKPANLFLTTASDGTPSVKVLDFGVSKINGALAVREDALAITASSPDHPGIGGDNGAALAETLQAPGITRTRALLGSPRYMAPEQLRSPRDVDVRADIWALGSILFELLSGEPPFDGDSLEELRRAVTGAPAPPLQSVAPQLEWAVHRCLAKAPRQRFASVPELADALAPFASSEGARCIERIARLARAPQPGSFGGSGSTPVSSGPTTEDAVVDSPTLPPKRKAWMTSGVAILALAMVGTAVVVVNRKAPDSPVVDAKGVNSPPLIARDEPRRAPASLVSPAAGVETAPARPESAASANDVVAVPSPAPPPSAMRPRTLARPSPAPTSAPVLAATAPPPSKAVAGDPLQIDAGLLFDGRK